jgi:putative sugar O-methyltransferase
MDSNVTKDMPNFALLDAMYKDHLSGPEVYHAAKFWEKLNQLNIEWLKTDGLNNFKRTVNNNYFNWMVTTKSDYFRVVARAFLGKIKRQSGKLGRIGSLLTANIGEMHHRTFATTETKTTWFQRKLYALYVLFLYEYVKGKDTLGLFDALEEPLAGNPLTIQKDGKRISQDISSSYMEYAYIREALGNTFSELKTIGEIGSGYGRLQYLLHLLHQKDGIKVVIIDLPPALLVAQWYMRSVFPEARIMGYRKFSDFSEIEQEFKASSICFLLPHQLELLPPGTIDLMMNISSLQEMSRNQINRYYELIADKARYFYTKQWMFWENWEDKIAVPAIMYPTRPEWELLSARIHPVHTKFFEAMFKLRQAD